MNNHRYPRLLGLELRFIGVTSALVLFIFTGAAAIFLHGLPLSDYRGWIAHEKERAYRTLGRLADIQKTSLANTIQSHLREVHLLAATLQQDNTLQGILTKIPPQPWKTSLTNQLTATSHRIHHQFTTPLSDLGFGEFHIVDLDTHLTLLASNPKKIGTPWQDLDLLNGLSWTGSVYVNQNNWSETEEVTLNMASLITTYDAPQQTALVLTFPVSQRLFSTAHTLQNLWNSAETIIVSRQQDTLHTMVMPYGGKPRHFQHPFFALAAKGHEGSGQGVDDRGTPVLMAYRHIRLYPEWSWGLVVKVDLAELMEPVNRVIDLELIIGSAAVALFILATALLTRRVTLPLRRLTTLAGRVAAGERQVRFQSKGRDEIALLAETMNALMNTIEKQLAQLEDRVADRTRALSEELAIRQHTELLLRESESRFNTILDNTGSIIFLKDDQGRYLLANRRFRELFWPHNTPLEGLTDQEIFPPLVALGLQQHDTLTLHQAKHTEHEEELPHGHSTHTYWMVRIALTDEKSGGLMVCGIGTDITERKSMEQRTRQSQKLEAIGTLAGGISHDFNNILAIIVGNAELGGLVVAENSEEKGCFDTILDASRRGRDLVNQLLTFSRRGGHVKELFNPLPVIKETKRFMRSSLSGTPPFHWRILAEEGSLYGDPTGLQQILMNLCTNAAQAVAEVGRGQVVVTWERVVLEQQQANTLRLQPGDYFALTVSDEGKGVPPEVRERLFDPFFTTKGVGKGTGLGLSVVHGIVTNWKGTMEVADKPEGGAEFRVYLPWIAGHLTPTGQNLPLPTGNGRVLFVDDEVLVVNFIQRQLTLLGHQATCCHTPAEALALFRDHADDFDVVISDYLMPGMNGLELLDRIKEIRPHIPRVICTGLRNHISMEQQRDMGILHILHKPIGVHELGAMLQTVLSHSAMP